MELFCAVVARAANVNPISIPAESDRIEIGLTFVFGRVGPISVQSGAQRVPKLQKTPLLTPTGPSPNDKLKPPLHHQPPFPHRFLACVSK